MEKETLGYTQTDSVLGLNEPSLVASEWEERGEWKLLACHFQKQFFELQIGQLYSKALMQVFLLPYIKLLTLCSVGHA